MWSQLRVMFVLYIFMSLLISNELHVELISSGFKKPVYLTAPNGKSDTLFIVEQIGRIETIIHEKKKTLLDIVKKVHQPKMPGDERGLLGMALHPKFMDNGKFYVNYVNRKGNTIISSFTCDRQSLMAKSSSEEIILNISQPYSNHNGGQLAFGPDGFLYVGLGDGGYAGDPDENGQNIETLLGTILRLNIDKGNPYSIPLDNPFYGHVNVREEIFCNGLRNPWRFSFDGKNGDIYIGDVGQSSWEEINYISSNDFSGKNFGWNLMEGSYCYPIENECSMDDLTMPIFEYPNNANYIKTLIGWNQNDAQGCSVTGGYVYRGSLISKLQGRYFFGDYCTGKVWSFIILNDELLEYSQWEIKGIQEDFYLSSFGEDGNGELYMINHTGNIYKIIDAK